MRKGRPLAERRDVKVFTAQSDPWAPSDRGVVVAAAGVVLAMELLGIATSALWQDARGRSMEKNTRERWRGRNEGFMFTGVFDLPVVRRGALR